MYLCCFEYCQVNVSMLYASNYNVNVKLRPYKLDMTCQIC